MKRPEAEKRLKAIFGHAHFYDHQWQTVEKLLAGERILLVEKTGFGKSLCYQFPATQFPGVTIVFSPLIALMRDQIQYLESQNIPAACLNSEQSQEANRAILDKAKANEIKILYIAPERQESLEWMEAVRRMNLSMVVIDEAHCISEWGHDFRPAFRRVVRLINRLPENCPVLATTATATWRVTKDVVAQLGEKTQLLRGDMAREKFHLRVVKCANETEKMVWLANFLQNANGAGLVYSGTRVNTKLYADWLKAAGVDAVNYNAGMGADRRKEIEQGLLQNRWKCIVSTNALGMGVDKPDIRFVVHTQIPQSLLHYYQEIGRGGRDGKPAEIVLLYHPADRRLPEYFVRNSRPEVATYDLVIETLRQKAMAELELMRATNLPQTQVRVALADLIDQNVVHEIRYNNRKKFEYRFDAPKLDPDPFEQLRLHKFDELDKMIAFAETSACRMRYLREFLGDSVGEDCGNCDNDLGEKNDFELSASWKKKIRGFSDGYFPELKVRSARSVLVDGVAAAYYGFSNVGVVIHRCKYENGGDFPDFLLKRTLRAVKHQFHGEAFDLVLYVPPTESGNLVRNFAERIANALNFPVSHDLTKKRRTKPQKIFQNPMLKWDNVKNVFAYQGSETVKGKKILLVDDIFDSGASIREIGWLLTRLGAKKVAPVVIAKTIGGDRR